MFEGFLLSSLQLRSYGLGEAWNSGDSLLDWSSVVKGLGKDERRIEDSDGHVHIKSPRLRDSVTFCNKSQRETCGGTVKKKKR